LEFQIKLYSASSDVATERFDGEMMCGSLGNCVENFFEMGREDLKRLFAIEVSVRLGRI
jgi:hypothetical protein